MSKSVVLLLLLLMFHMESTEKRRVHRTSELDWFQGGIRPLSSKISHLGETKILGGIQVQYSYRYNLHITYVSDKISGTLWVFLILVSVCFSLILSSIKLHYVVPIADTFSFSWQQSITKDASASLFRTLPHFCYSITLTYKFFMYVSGRFTQWYIFVSIHLGN